MTTPRIVSCLVRKCRRYRGLLGPPDDPVFICEAFVRGIPEIILAGRDKHLKPREGDGGLTYEPRPKIL